MVPKFRCWDEPNKTMRFNNEIVIWSGQVYINEKKKLDSRIKGYSCLPKHLMQSTGLKDKNGVEVFQGDIVKVTDEDEEYSYISVVKNYAEEGYPAFDIEYPSDWEYESNALSTIMSGGYETIEIIGNIYENPELLEQANES
ncbi:YopX family protein [Enterococcus sp.]|uniref:YopX family protein n=1 Tax=Enterococcus sp. TaxID=35783 RepID=UPI003995AD2E